MLFTAMAIVGWIALAIVAWALIDCALRPPRAFPAVGRQTKPAWLIFLALALVVQLLFDPLGLLGIGSLVLAVYYLADVRSRVAALSRR